MSRLLCAICHKYRASRGYFPPRCTDCRRMELADAAAARRMREAIP